MLYATGTHVDEYYTWALLLYTWNDHLISLQRLIIDLLYYLFTTTFHLDTAGNDFKLIHYV